MTALEERRQAAREAAYDALARCLPAFEAGIETATRVRITPEILAATGLPAFAARAVLEAGFRAAGFEVEQ